MAANIDNTDNIDPREAKLPMWAQDKLAAARRRVAEATQLAEAARLATDPEGSSAILDPYGPKIGLGKNANVRFLPSGADDWHGWVAARVQGEWLELMGESGLEIRPQVTNVIRVRVQPGRF